MTLILMNKMILNLLQDKLDVEISGLDNIGDWG